MKRRDFFKTAGAVAVADVLLHANPGAEAAPAKVAEEKYATLQVRDDKIYAETHTLSAVIDKGFITTLRSKRSGESFLQHVDITKSAALQLIYSKEEVVPIDESKFGNIVTTSLSTTRAEIAFHGWDGDGIMIISVDVESGDLLIEPSAFSSRPGVRACRWNLRDFRSDLELVAPFFQGIKLALSDPLIKNTRWHWPMFWEAGLVILQSKNGGFWVHTQDNRYRYKALQVGSATAATCLGFDSEAYGPIDENKSAGGLVWRLNVFEGDWIHPAKQYRQWLWHAYRLGDEEHRRRPWIHDVSFAVSWCPTDVAILQAIAKKLDPRKVLLHLPNWRTDPYDENYPQYIASDAARAFIQQGQDMGFHVMPHFNAVDMDPSHPSYALLHDFQYRDIEDKTLGGWSWYQGRGLGVPESNASRLKNRDKKVMIKVHPGLAMWRSILGRAILNAVRTDHFDTVFIDVTLVSHNLHTCLVEGMTSTEGMRKLINHVAELGEGLVVGGEGLNEITMQGQSFAQAHLFKSWQASIEGLERTGGCNLNERLFGRLCHTIGYSGLGGRTPNEELRMRMQLEHGAIPTVTIRSAADIIDPNPAVKRMLELASS
ncbi:hypothetical protein JW998_12320 [candidate division KSB1 bacterium]|nr:hypothetical protein [candidate division KSB1 bacterium]